MKPSLRNCFVFIFGAITAWCVCALSRPSSGERRDELQDTAIAGVSYHYGDEARRLASVAGLSVPKQGTDVFYGMGGLKPVVEFIAFTLPPKDVWPTLTALSEKNRTDLQEVSYFHGPEMFGTNKSTLLFRPSNFASRTGLEWQLKPHLKAASVIDEVTGRVFIFISPTE